LLEDPSIKLLYQRRLEQNLRHSPCSLNINEEWQKRRHKRRLILWNEDIKNLIENKKKAYLWYLATHF